MSENSTSRGLAGAAHEPCAWCSQPRRSHGQSSPLHHAFSTESQVALSLTELAAWERGIHPLVRVDVGSSSTRHGGAASRSWSATASSVSVCRRLKHAKFDATSGRAPSTRGTATSKTSGSSKSSSAADDTTGTVALTTAEEYGDHRVVSVNQWSPWVGREHFHVVCADKTHTDYGRCFTCGMTWEI